MSEQQGTGHEAQGTAVITPRRVPLIYVAGPYRPTVDQRVMVSRDVAITQNIRAAHGAGRVIVLAGGMPLTPHKCTEHFDRLIPDEEFIARDIGTYLPLCDGVWAIKNWEQSTGARAEVLHALERYMMVVETEQEMRDWVGFCLNGQIEELPAWATVERTESIERRARGGGA